MIQIWFSEQPTLNFLTCEKGHLKKSPKLFQPQRHHIIYLRGSLSLLKEYLKKMVPTFSSWKIINCYRYNMFLTWIDCKKKCKRVTPASYIIGDHLQWECWIYQDYLNRLHLLPGTIFFTFFVLKLCRSGQKPSLQSLIHNLSYDSW